MRLIDRLQFGFTQKMPVYMQAQAAECGLISLAMVAAYHGDEPDLTALRGRYRASAKGTSFEQLLDIAAGLHLTGRALRVDLEHLAQVQLPCILHWDMGHFVVLASLKGNKAVIHDPALGRRTMRLTEISSHFTGAVLELMPSSEFSSQPTGVRPKIKLWDMTGKVKGLKRSMAHIFCIGLAVEVLVLISPFFIQWVTDHAIVSGDKELLLALVLGFCSLLVVRTVLEGVRGWAITVMSVQFNLQWMTNIFTHLLRLPILYYERRHMGDIVSRFGVVQTLQNTLTVTFVEAFVDGLMVVGTLVMMCLYSLPLAGIAVVAALLYVITRFSMYGLMREASNEKIMHEAKQQTLFMETIRNVTSLRMANREEVRISAWLNHLVHMKNSSLRQQRYSLVFHTVNSLVFGLSRTLVVGLGAMAVIEGRFSVGMLFAFIAYKDQFSSRASNLIDKMFELRLLELQGMRLADIVFAKPEQDPRLRALPQVALSPVLELRGVRMRYAESEPVVLDGCNLLVQPGQIVCITGHAGCGKTTLIKAMLGLFPNHGGEVWLGGMAVKKLGLHNFRDYVAGVLQDERPLGGTVAENVCFFAAVPDEDLLERCTRAVGLHDEINALPMRYQTLIGDMGTALSASQKQKLLLARALYRQPRIVVLDEATSHLNAATHAIFFAACKQLGVSLIFSTSRPETVGLADRLCVLQGGKLHEQDLALLRANANAPTAPTEPSSKLAS